MMRRVWLGLAGLALMVAPISLAGAQTEGGAGAAEEVVQADSVEPEAVLDVAPVRSIAQDDLAQGAVIVGEGEPLALEDAIALALRNGLNVEVERYAPLIAESNAQAAWGVYDPVLAADARYDVDKSPNTFPLNQTPTNRDRTQGGGVGLTQMIPYIGASFDARFDSTARVTRSTFEPFDERYDSAFFVGARVPLMRDLIWNSNWTNVKVSAFQSEAAEQQFRQSLMDNVQATVNRYWALVAARDRVRVAQKSLETARALLAQTKTQYEVGVVSQVEVVEAESGVANREFELIQGANVFRNEQDLLIEAVYGTRLEADTDVQLFPTADLDHYSPRSVDVEGSVARAFANRPELHAAQSFIEQDEVDLRFAKSQRLPQLDLVARYGFVGVAGDGNDGFRFQIRDQFGNPVDVPPPTDRVYGESVDDFFTDDGAGNLLVQGVFSVPIPNTGARRRVTLREFELRRSKTTRKRVEQGIVLEVRAASRTLLSAGQRIEAAERRRLAAEEQLRAERIRLEHGESTPFEVLQREEDLVEAESQKIAALQLFHAAETALDRAEGTILEEHAIEVDAVRAPVR